MKEQIEQLLPQIKAGKLSDTEIQEQIDKIKNAIKQDSSKGKEYGELLSRIKQTCITKNLPPIANWVNTGKGYLAIGHKPGGKVSYEGLGANSVLTLLNENLITKQSLEWIWFPFSASNPLDSW
jgi:hypothetical protein